MPLIDEQFEVIMSECDDFPASSSHNRMIANLKSHQEADTKKMLCMHLMLMHRTLRE